MKNLNSLKGFCILMIIITHGGWEDSLKLQLLFPYWINMAVPIFMVISGYLYTMSLEKKNITSLTEYYSLDNLVKKILRFTIPFTIVLLVEMLIEYFTYRTINIASWVHLFIVGGKGPGSYYFPIMIQFVFVFPVIYYVVKTKKYGLWMMLLCNIMYEILKICYYLEENTYRLLVFRYIFVIAFGCYIYLEKKKNIQLWHVIFMGVGIIYIYITQYMGYQSKIFIYWSSTSVIASLYILPFMVWYIHKGKGISILGMLGKASFNIFLVQMVYYNSVKGFVNSIYEIGFYENILMAVIICVIVGELFYIVEGYFSRFIVGKCIDVIEVLEKKG